MDVMMVFRPLRVTRVANIAPGLVLVGAGLLLLGNLADPELAGATAVGVAFATILLAAGVVLAIRGYRMAVLCADHTVVVRGLFKSTRVPRAAVVGIDVIDSVLVWLTPQGHRRATLITAFFEFGRVLSFVRAHNAASLDRLRGLLGEAR